ncbi:hypothetical protein COU78_06760 [Candidatus Peregrinibacteria bacterium CG10_big_fil_rev_8_21_14_0_10_49_24]|nr:MAG: hypothetical protein COV83_02055 [Candidatus Peregrinibacteria bacterium CG11_big_fil_rev_8_21_14_0_20_49_14]PIR50390.1 MAG: hypothetical protein COU78_06760 [Candidatus Peregrinibacteria bacterium CG10_big_fil_rev_8_21_14_0_10_49_24]PJA67479.1 MAG: hypothetical protein CO157_03550 [Candidatus Peregrinibacteria bacterium CG_4_9_14_3_um_filter_49_12]
MNEYWFKPKRYGYGFYPTSWQGWVATFILLILVLLAGAVDGVFEEGATLKQVARFMLDTFFITSIATIIFERKLKERLGWRWGYKQ